MTNYHKDTIIAHVDEVYNGDENDLDFCSVLTDDARLIIDEQKLAVLRISRLFTLFETIDKAYENQPPIYLMSFMDVFLPWITDKMKVLESNGDFLDMLERDGLIALVFKMKQRFDELTKDKL